MGEFYSFKDMEVWKLSMSLCIKMADLTKHLPRYEDYALNSQIRRCTNSISSNIAEGFGRRTSADKRNFYVMARGSAFEAQNHLFYGRALGYFQEKECKEYLNQYNELIHQLNKLIKTLT